jgi:carboxyl-terminal processing protease
MSVVEGTRLLRGEPGTKVSLTVLRGNIAEPHVLVLVREKETVPDVTSRMAAPGVGYVRIAAFGPRTAEQLKAKLDELSKGGATSLVVDLQRTADGPLESGIEAARLFVKAGKLAVRETRAQPSETLSAGPGDGSVTVPVFILATNGTSGAAEVFAAALRDNKRAQIVGERTLGRAATQKLVKLPDGSALWLTSSRYLTPAGPAIHLKGLAPDVEVAEPDVEFGAPAPATDPILDKALQQAAVKKAA